MEAIFEALALFIFELAFGIVGGIIEGVLHALFSGDFLTLINRHLPESSLISSEITTLNISDYHEENFQ